MQDLGPCPLCGRPLVEGRSIDKHHLMPKSRGGRDTWFIHRICHSKIHSLFTNKELEARFHTFEALREDEDVARFISWVRKKPPTFMGRNKTARRKRS